MTTKTKTAAYKVHEDCGREALSWNGPGYQQTIGYWSDNDEMSRGVIVRPEALGRLVRQANAASELYGAAKDALEAFDQHDERWDGCEGCDALHALESAIAKAEGQE